MSDSTTNNPQTLVVSIRDYYARKIFLGRKTVELRRRFRAAEGAKLLVYVPRPVAAVIGHVFVNRVERLDILEIWRRYSVEAAVELEDFKTYFSGVDCGCAVILGKSTKYDTAISLRELRTRYGMHAPQSYLVLRQHHSGLMNYEHS